MALVDARTAMAIRRTLIDSGKARMILWDGYGDASRGMLEAWIEDTVDYLQDVTGHLRRLPETANRKHMIETTTATIDSVSRAMLGARVDNARDLGELLYVSVSESIKYMGLFTRPEEPPPPTPQDKRQKTLELARKRAERELPPSPDDEASALGAMALKVRRLESALKDARELNIEHALRVSMMHRRVNKLLSGDYMPTPDAIARAMYVPREALNAEVERTYGKKSKPKP